MSPNQQQASPHVGATYESHGVASPPADQHWWQWWGYPSWAFTSWQSPWYSLPPAEQRCYFDPYQGAWVCPASPYVYQPITTRFIVSPWWGGRWGRR